MADKKTKLVKSNTPAVAMKDPFVELVASSNLTVLLLWANVFDLFEMAVAVAFELVAAGLVEHSYS